MPLYEIDKDSNLNLFRQLQGGEELYESELEGLLWNNIEELTGESLFRVSQQPKIGTGGRPDIVALTDDGRVVVIEVKRDIDRSQLAQCLEYAGWARRTNLDELAGIYHAGSDEFFRDWQEFTETPRPILIQRAPRLILVARDFHGRTGSAFEFLVEHGLPVHLLRMAIYEDAKGRRFVDIEGDFEADPSEAAAPEATGARVESLVEGRRVRLADLVDAGLLNVGDRLTWERPRSGQSFSATVTDAGALRLDDGRVFSTPSRAATEAAGIPAYDGWLAWKTNGGRFLRELRGELVKRRAESPAE